MPMVPPNPGFMQEKVQKGYFLKKDAILEAGTFLVFGCLKICTKCFIFHVISNAITHLNEVSAEEI